MLLVVGIWLYLTLNIFLTCDVSKQDPTLEATGANDSPYNPEDESYPEGEDDDLVDSNDLGDTEDYEAKSEESYPEGDDDSESEDEDGPNGRERDESDSEGEQEFDMGEEERERDGDEDDIQSPNEFCPRGLEYKTNDCYQQRQAAKREIRTVVFEEQDFQREQGMVDTMWIAKLSEEQSRNCVSSAIHIAKQDARDAQEYQLCVSKTSPPPAA